MKAQGKRCNNCGKRFGQLKKIDRYTIEEYSKKIQEYLQKHLSETLDLQWDIITKGDLDNQLSPSQVLNLFRIIQEATQNILKYIEICKRF
jgi:two-component sensor histidine kinase